MEERSCAWTVAEPRPISSVTRATSRLAKSSRALSSCSCARCSRSSEPHQHVALGDRLALAIAEVDDAAADQGRHLGPAHRLHGARRIDDLDRGSRHGATAVISGPRPMRHHHTAVPIATSAASQIRTLKRFTSLPCWPPRIRSEGACLHGPRPRCMYGVGYGAGIDESQGRAGQGGKKSGQGWGHIRQTVRGLGRRGEPPGMGSTCQPISGSEKIARLAIFFANR